MQAVDRKSVHLPQEMVQGLIQIPLHLQFALHIGLPQCQGGAVHQLLHRYSFPDVNGKHGIAMAYPVFVVLPFYQKGIIRKSVQKLNHCLLF